MSFQDYSAALDEPMTQRFIRRHRLEKRDPSAAMSEAVEPIVYYLDPGTPEPVRSALLDGARWWNQAFEAAGFIDAFRVEVRPEDVSSHDVRYNVINWVHRSTRGWSTGGSVTDPRTGEILKGNVTLGSLRVRQDYLIAEGLLAPYENGDENPAGLAEWALARIRQLSAHEVGHTLGLGHNYYDSDLGRISVLDYPHPLITHDGTDFDYSEVYDVDIGEWDKVAIRYGYSHFPPGTDEKAELDRILEEAWDDDVRYFSNQDVSTHARVDQWSNGTDAGAELERMLDVRRAALERFGERAIRAGRPMAQMEEVLVPLYLHHRYQVTAAASVLGGLHYTYATRGDGMDPVRPASAAEQQRALDGLVRAVQPAELTIPATVLDRLPPRPSGYGRTRELFPRYTGSMFDAISPAVVATAHVVGEVFNPSRAARLLEQNALDPSLPGLEDVIGALVAVGDPAAGDTPYEAEVRRAVGRVVADGLMRLAGVAAMPQVRREPPSGPRRSTGSGTGREPPSAPRHATGSAPGPPGRGSCAPSRSGDRAGGRLCTPGDRRACLRGEPHSAARGLPEAVDDDDALHRVVIHPRQDVDALLESHRAGHQPVEVGKAGSDHAEHPVVFPRLQAVAAHHFQLPGDDPVHGNPGVAMIAGHEAHLNVASAPAQAGYRVEAGVRMAQGVHGGVRAALGNVADLLGDVRGTGRVHARDCPEVPRPRQRLLANVHRHHVGPQRARNHHGREPDPAAPVNGHPVTRRDPALRLHRTERCRESTPQTGGGDEPEIVRQRRKREVGLAERHQLGEATPAVKSRLELMGTHLLVSGAATPAPAAPGDERNRHPVSLPPAPDVTPDLHHDTGDLVTGHMGEHDVRIVAYPTVPVASADPVGLHAEDHSVRCRLRIRERLDGDGTTVFSVNCCLQGDSPLVGTGPDDKAPGIRVTFRPLTMSTHAYPFSASTASLSGDFVPDFGGAAVGEQGNAFAG